MGATPYKSAAPLVWKDGTLLDELSAWQREEGDDNSERLARLRRNLRRVRQEELTPRQALVVEMYYDRQMTIPQIARELSVCKSTVARTLHRGEARLKRYLQYSL